MGLLAYGVYTPWQRMRSLHILSGTAFWFHASLTSSSLCEKMKRIFFRRKSILRAIHAACLALFLAATTASRAQTATGSNGTSQSPVLAPNTFTTEPIRRSRRRGLSSSPRVRSYQTRHPTRLLSAAARERRSRIMEPCPLITRAPEHGHSHFLYDGIRPSGDDYKQRQPFRHYT